MHCTISVIIPTLNEAATIATAVATILAAGPQEVIVADGGSCDATCELAADAGARVVASQPGRGTQLNAGAGEASGDVLLFLHADCRLHGDGLLQIDRALADPRVFGGAFRQSIEADGWLYRLLERGNAFRASRLRMPYGDQGIFLRRDTFDKLQGFPNVPLMEDLLLMKRFRRLSQPVLLPGPLFVSARRWQQHGIIRQTARNWTLLAARALGVSPDRLAKYYSAASK